jgi:dihydroorotase
MVHIDHPPPTLEEVLERMCEGDILTHCFRPFPNNPATANGSVRSSVIEARKRGVIFDIGHGMGSFVFKTARAMLDKGFEPDCISSDVHAPCIDGPAFDLLTTMSKFICLGMKLDHVVRAATGVAAWALRREDLGNLRPGAVGDASILELETGEFEYVDVTSECMTGERLSARGIVLNGRLWEE